MLIKNMLLISTEWGSSRNRGFAGEAIYSSRVNFVKTWVSMFPEGSVFHVLAVLHSLVQNRRKITGILCFFLMTLVWSEFFKPKLSFSEHKISPKTLSLSQHVTYQEKDNLSGNKPSLIILLISTVTTTITGK